MDTQFITAVFKLRRPSAWQREAIDRTFDQYTLATGWLLAWAEQNFDLLHNQGLYKTKYSTLSILKLLPSASLIPGSFASCLKESILKDVASGLTSFFELDRLGLNPSFPTIRDISPLAYDNALQELVIIGNDLEAENEARDRLLAVVKGQVNPITYCRSRDFAILKTIDSDRYLVYIKLFEAKQNDRKIASQGNLVDLATGEVWKYKGGGGVLIPLELDSRRGMVTKYLTPLERLEAFIKSAKLVKKPDGYYLNVSIGVIVPQPYDPQSYLGIDRGILYTMAYAVVDKSGRPLVKAHCDDGIRSIQLQAGKKVQDKASRGLSISIKDYRRKQQEEVMHRLVNQMIKLAQQFHAMIVMEDLNIQVKGKFVKSAWKKLHRITEYKCRLAGVPFKKEGVFAAYSSQICIHCGETVNRDDRIVTCPNCGAIEHSDEAAAVNIARRIMYRKAEWIGGYREFHRSFR